MARFREWPLDCKVYVGNLGEDGNEAELEKSFSRYGTVRNCWVARNPSGFAFILMEDPRDAEDAVRGLDGTRMCGHRVVVEMSSGKTRRDRLRGGDRGGGGGGGRYGGRDGYYDRDRDRDNMRYRRSRSRSRDRSYRDSHRSRSRSADRDRYNDRY